MTASRGDEERIDPEIARFVDAILAGTRDFHDFADRPLPERRWILEQVRAPWGVGGPAMARREDHLAPFGENHVRLRLLAPEGLQSSPALIYLHGGGFALFSLDTHDRLMREYAAAAGIAVIGVDYSLSPEVRFPTALHETLAAIDWITASAGALGIDPSRIAIGGDSAGANLALAACISLRDRGRGDVIAGMLLNYGFFDADFTTASQLRHGAPGGMLTTDELAGFLDTYFGPDAPRNDPLALPALAQLHDLPPSLHIVAQCDPLADGDRALAARLRSEGSAAQLNVYAGATHSFLEAMAISAIARQAIADSADWLARTLAPPEVASR